jgi:hypothetical protein
MDSNISNLLDLIKNIKTFSLSKRCVDYFMENYPRLLEDKRVTLSDLTIIFKSFEEMKCEHSSRTTIKA